MGHLLQAKQLDSALEKAVMEIKTGGESELSPRKIRWRTPGSLLQVSQAGPFKAQLMPWLSRVQKTLLYLSLSVMTFFSDSPGCLSHSAFEPLHCCSLT